MGLITDFGKWIDSKFPDKVVVTDSDYKAHVSRLSSVEKELNAQDLRIKNLCKELVDLRIEEIKTDLNKLKLQSGLKGIPGLPPSLMAR